MRYHISATIDYALVMKLTRGLKVNGTEVPEDEARALLLAEKAKGREFILFSECDHQNWVTGACLGHEVQS